MFTAATKVRKKPVLPKFADTAEVDLSDLRTTRWPRLGRRSQVALPLPPPEASFPHPEPTPAQRPRTVAPQRPWPAIPSTNRTSRRPPPLPGLTPHRSDPPALPGLTEARQSPRRRADTLATLETLPPLTRAPKEKAKRRLRWELLPAALIYTVTAGLVLTLLVATGYKYVGSAFAQSMMLFACATFGALVALGAIPLVRLLRVCSRAAAASIVVMAGLSGLAMGWLARAVIPDGLSEISIGQLTALPAALVEALGNNLDALQTLITLQHGGAWLAEAFLTLIVITAAARWCVRQRPEATA